MNLSLILSFKKQGKFKGRKLEVTVGGKKEEKTAQAMEWYKEGKSVRYICKTKNKEERSRLFLKTFFNLMFFFSRISVQIAT